MPRNKEAATGIFGIIFGAVLFILSYQVKDFASIGVGAGFLPRISAVLFIIVGTFILLKGARSGTEKAEGKPAEEKNGKTAKLNPVLLSMLLLCTYVALLKPVGFIICSALYIFLQSIILSKGSKQNYLALAAISAIASASAYVLFVRVFQVMIPAGLLG